MAFESQRVGLVQATHRESHRVHRPWLYRAAFKRPLDIAAVVLTSPVVVPLILFLALVICLRDRANPFYSQQRVGRGGRNYRMWKLRTMVPDADERLETYLRDNPNAAREWELTQKLRVDPRVTRMGQMLRASSLDELPQLINVFTGDMSLVGPRPMMPEQKAMYSGQGYFQLRPGITGLWQTAGRNRTSFAARAGYDDSYESSLSFGRDFGILLRTVSVVISRTGY